MEEKNKMPTTLKDRLHGAYAFKKAHEDKEEGQLLALAAMRTKYLYPEMNEDGSVSYNLARAFSRAELAAERGNLLNTPFGERMQIDYEKYQKVLSAGTVEDAVNNLDTVHGNKLFDSRLTQLAVQKYGSADYKGLQEKSRKYKAEKDFIKAEYHKKVVDLDPNKEEDKKKIKDEKKETDKKLEKLEDENKVSLDALRAVDTYEHTTFAVLEGNILLAEQLHQAGDVNYDFLKDKDDEEKKE